MRRIFRWTRWIFEWTSTFDEIFRWILALEDLEFSVRQDWMLGAAVQLDFPLFWISR
jgi:hypothetical protein